MDIMPDNTTALAVTNSNSISSLFTIDLMTGAVNVGKFTASVISIAFKTNPIAYATTATNMLVRFNQPMERIIGSINRFSKRNDSWYRF
jgi:hypothetical protein